ncbi:hypothetical protein BGW36DRAFT_293073 [Talaromyces proteolyticus]|uniref:BTB domain-containing protein n=1 Tax=Talaromyces proteolyticus TaxID=1131652 RepID=A0AAD4Q2M1_9EURO|nr:uncharacterized protein BGW36DRAFT_293073 [Talaromyces proteolyticus]KAH8700552.1 hypothetical protein BGW36DRAFT_293073 [Talaromyces proteolyticus]
MFSKKMTYSRSDSFSDKYRAGKSTSRSMKRSFREHSTSSRATRRDKKLDVSPVDQDLTSAIITIAVGKEQRLFAAHEHVLCMSPFFAACCRGQFLEPHNKQINLPDEQPEILSCILEFLYKGDYYPRLVHDKRRDTWEVENDQMDTDGESALLYNVDDTMILKDTVIYCAAVRYSLPDLKRLALRKQGLQSGVHCSTILSSARYAYAHTPDTDSKLRAHYLALIIRSRSTFKRSGTMQMEMEQGGKLFFDLFVAMSNHMVNVLNLSSDILN